MNFTNLSGADILAIKNKAYLVRYNKDVTREEYNAAAKLNEECKDELVNRCNERIANARY